MKKPARWALTLFLPASLAHAQPAAMDKPWKETAQLTFLNANGNTKSTTLGADNTFQGTLGRWTLELPAGALSAKTQGKRSAEQYHAGEKIRYTMTERTYVFEKFRWDRDVFAGFAHRYDVSGGIGREWIKGERNELSAELGGGYINEQLATGGRNQFGSGRAYAKYARALSPTAAFSQDAEYLHNFKESRDFRVNAQSAVTASVTTHFSLKVAYGWKFRHRPPPGFAHSDTLASLSGLVNF